MHCNQCSAARINGVFCHEVGCPNSGKTWDSDREEWIKYVDCFECGYPVEIGESCDCQNFEDDLDEDDLDEEYFSEE